MSDTHTQAPLHSVPLAWCLDEVQGGERVWFRSLRGYKRGHLLPVADVGCVCVAALGRDRFRVPVEALHLDLTHRYSLQCAARALVRRFRPDPRSGLSVLWRSKAPRALLVSQHAETIWVYSDQPSHHATVVPALSTIPADDPHPEASAVALCLAAAREGV